MLNLVCFGLNLAQDSKARNISNCENSFLSGKGLFNQVGSVLKSECSNNCLANDVEGVCANKFFLKTFTERRASMAASFSSVSVTVADTALRVITIFLSRLTLIL